MTREEFLKIVDKYLAGQASAEEEQTLFNFFNSFQKSGGGDERLPELKQQLEQKMLARLLTEVRRKKDARSGRVVIMRSPFRWSFAAAVVVLLFLAGRFYYHHYLIPENEAVVAEAAEPKNDIVPGGNKAVLTLADGSSVVLDSAANGMLASQGAVSVKKIESGKLVYRPGENHGSDAGLIQARNNRIVTPRGGQYQLIPADGTHVWLNAASSLSFPAEFNGNERKVELSGEAYFDVARNSKKPFIVISGEEKVEVLGTGFNIRAYSDEKSYETTLVEGSIKVSRNNTSRLLKPGQQARTGPGGTGGISLVSGVDTEEITAWKDGLFMFNQTPVEDAMQQIEKWYDAEIVYEGAHPLVSFTGVIPRSASVSKILKVLEAAGGVKFSVDGKKIIISKNG